jgi:hypothetical protein
MPVRLTTLAIAAGGLVVFLVGFLLLHGPLTKESGAWTKTITHDDEYAFWVIADGAARTPPSDANPFYAEAAGVSNPWISYPTVVAAGRLARWLDVPVLALLPVWKVGAPFALWLALWFVLWRCHGVARLPAAAVALVVLAGTLVLAGHAQHLATRFSRPLDGLVPATLWLGLVTRPAPLRGRSVLVAGLSAAGVLLLSPYLAAFATLTTGLLWLQRRDAASRPLLGLAVASSVAGLAMMAVLMAGAGENRWMSAALGFDGSHAGGRFWFGLALGLGAIAAVVLRRRHVGPRPSDAVLLSVLAIEPASALVEPLLGQGYGFALHRYYYLAFEVLAMLYWLVDREHGAPTKPSTNAVASLAAIAVGLSLHPTTSIFRGIHRAPGNSDLDNGHLLLVLAPILFVVVQIGRRMSAHAAWKRAAPAVAVSFALLCFANGPRQLTTAHEELPFSGAHNWLADHAQAGEAVLTLPPDYGLYDYAPLVSDVTVYYNHYASRLTADDYEREYRKSIYFSLYCGVLDQPGVPIPVSLDERLREFRLDYILASKGELEDRWRRQVAPQLPPLAGRVDRSVRRQLGERLHTVYEDDESVLWRVVLP